MKCLILIACLALGASARTVFNGCGGDLQGENGVFNSPNYPNNYANNQNCEWTISVSAGILELSFSSFDVESSYSGCSYDSLKIYDGESNDLLATLCGTSAGSVQAKSSSIRAVFKSDSSVTKGGWSATWGKLSCGGSSSLSCVADASSCDGTVKPNHHCDNGGVCCQAAFNQGQCGVVDPVPTLIGGKPRIVGGEEATPHSWPWQVSLRTTSSSFHFCGGSLVNDQWVVTAAHCVDGDTPSSVKITTGEHDKGVGGDNAVDHAVSKIIMHANYNGNGNGFPNDIALMKLSSPISMNEHRTPICLADSDEEFTGTSCFITGWGDTKGTSDADTLNQLAVSVWEQRECIDAWGSNYINNGHICVGTGSEGACNGDSGGPLACQKQGRWILAGATSWGYSGCQTAGYPSVYSRISYFRDWIIDNIQSN